ncbi:hypothetical protein [Hydrogenophaga sp. BPS33]|uniref:hypothetical protein n=1 Tax=Hydrogenophaga sp. BPS33 TaxID=2651974 RepID=UPI00131FC3EB|nr:hypothetical protein [Hydrogenophaga sp. BPS33]QHE84903.1 hypothetical protein F9K07_08385 [Hydrogenophaga sp. BPS33]
MKSVGFESELQLVEAIAACTKRARRREYRTELEVDAGVGIADLVLAKRAPRSTKALRALASITPRLAALLSHDVAATVTSRASLANSLGTSELGAQRVLAQLAAAGLALGTRKAISLTAISTLPFEKVIAVEAKLSEWRRVLVQAYRNLQFADESWVVLDHACVRPALAQSERFQAAGVGLASMDRNLGLFIHLPAASVGPMSTTKRWQAQAVLAARAVARRPLSESL